ncbi:MAG: hypothetical protein L3K02_02585 [Thermoplasmata archaeon]|nr:hypothetical protein [Thermoplasmata archaeon]
MSAHRFGSLLRLIGEAIHLEVDFGSHSVEALAWIAETVNASVYVPDSLTRTPTGFRFSLANPPLRIGAFSGLRLRVEGTVVPPEVVRVRLGDGRPWRTSSELGPDRSLDLEAGNGIELEADWPLPPTPGPVTIRLELQSVAIPPLVWLELQETPREGSAA